MDRWRGVPSPLRMARARWLRISLLAVVMTLGLQLLPPGIALPGIGPRAAFASTPVAPPAPVDPSPKVAVVTTPGPTEASGSLTQDTVWSPQGSPYVIRTGFAVPVGISLTLLPGTVVKILGSGLTASGQLLVLGTADKRVVFTSLKDDSVMGDTNGDGSATSPAPGDWRQIAVSGYGPLQGGERSPLSVIDNADVRFGGSGSSCTGYGELEVSGQLARVVVTNSSFASSQYSQVYVSGEVTDSVSLYANTFTQGAGPTACGVTMYGANADVIGNTFSGVNLNATSGKMRIWRNYFGYGLSVSVTDMNAVVSRSTVDIRFNTLLGGSNQYGHFDWSANWWGDDANVLPGCVASSDASTHNPPLTITYDPTACPAAGWRVTGYAWTVLPALSSAPQTALPPALLEATAPRFGPVDTYSGALTYQTTDLTVADAGKSIPVTRTYHSDKPGSGDLSTGWSTAYSEALSTIGGSSTLMLDDGSSVPFNSDPAAGYIPAPGVSAGYTTGSGGSTITTTDRVGYEFNVSGELTGVTLGDSGHHLNVDRSGGKVIKVTGVSGRHIDYSRSGGLLQQVTDSTSGSVTMGYTSGQLTSVTGVDGQADTYAYDSSGRLSHVYNASGQTVLNTSYDSSGRVAWVEQLGSGRTTFSYDPANSTTTATLPDGATMVQQYDALGRLVTERVGTTGRHVVYDGFGRAIADITGVPGVAMTGYGSSAPAVVCDFFGNPALTIDALGGYQNVTFNTAHQPLVTTRNDGTTISRTYDGSGRMSSVVDPRGKTWSYTYNGFGEVTKQTDPLNRDRTVTYAGNGDATAVTDETGATTHLGYDSQGRRTSVTDPLGNETDTAYTSWDTPMTVTSPRAGVTSMTFDIAHRQLSTTDPVGGVTSYQYDTSGRLAVTVDPLNGQSTIDYDTLGRPIEVTDARSSIYQRTYTSEGWAATSTDPDGKVTGYAYDPAGRPIRVTDPTGAVTQTVYDRNGHKIEVDTPDGAVQTWQYNNMGRLAQYTLPRGGVQKTTYDAAGNVTSVLGPRGLTGFPYTLFGVTATYDDAGRLATRSDAMGTTTTFAYNDTTRTTTVTDPLGTAAVVTRNAAGKVVSQIDGTGGTTAYGYDADGNTTTVTDPTNRVTSYGYDLDRRPITQTDPAGRITTVAYDMAGRTTSITYPGTDTDTYVYDATGDVTDHGDRTGHHWTYAYNAAGHVLTATDPLTHATTYTYDDDGRQTSQTDASGVITNTAYDPVGRPAVTWDVTGASWVTNHDLDGNTSSTVDPAGVTWTYTYDKADQHSQANWGSGTPAYSYTYDNAGRLTQRTDPYITKYGYDARGRTTTVTDALNNVTTNAYDGAGRLLSTTPPNGHATTATYDAAGRIATGTDGAGDTSHYGYDNAGQLSTLTLPRGGVYTYTYSADGDTASRTDPLGWVTGYTYDGEGHPTQISHPSGRTENSVYDAAGQLTSQTSGTSTRSYSYDPAGRIAGAVATGATLAYTYDNRGLLSSSSDPLGVTTYSYDSADRLTTRTPPAGTPATITYNDRGLPTAVTTAGTVNLSYNNAGQVTNQSEGSHSSEAFNHDNNGRITTAGTTTATYNADGRMASLTQNVSGNPAANTTAFSYDNAGRLSSAALSQNGSLVSTTNYGWDADSNRTSVAVTGSATVTSTYNLADQVTGDSTGASYTYNKNGELTVGPTAATTYAYNPFGELKTAATASGTVTYTYDALNRTSSRAVGTTTQKYGYDGLGNGLAAQQVGTTTTNLIRDPSGRLLTEATVGGATSAVHSTVHGDISRLVDTGTGANAWSSVYNAFGGTTTTGTAPVTLGFQSMYTDAATGLVDMGARSYSPTTDTFTTPDTLLGALGSPATLNRYLYGNADPLDFFDPDGHWSISGAWDSFTSAVSQAWGSFTSTVSQDWSNFTNQVSSTAQQTWSDLKSNLSGAYHQASQALHTYAPTIKATAASFVVGGVVFLGCEAITAGVGSVGCAVAAGAAGGGVYGAMMCPAGQSTARCATVGALAGGVAGLTGGVAAEFGGGAFAVGAISGGSGDAVNQLLTTGHVDGGELLTASLTGGVLGYAGGKLASGAGKLPGRLGDDGQADGAVGLGGCRHSFDPNTPVVMADGSTESIKDVRVGDQVESTDPGTGKTGTHTVTALHRTDDTDLTDLRVRTADGHISWLHTTQHHPFRDDTRNMWIDAGQLQAGDRLHTLDGRLITVVLVHNHTGRHHMRDLTIDTTHTYYVMAGGTAVLVHNCGTTPNNSPGTLADEQSAANSAGVTPLRAGSSGFNDAVAGGGRHIWSVSEDGTLNIAKWGEDIKHPILNGGAPVRGAGEVVFGRGGLVTDINNATGHYIPTCGCGADLQAGVDAFNNAGVPVLRGAIKAFGW